MTSARPHPSPAGFVLVFALANAGGVIAYLPLLSLLLPMKVALLAGPARLGVFTATVIAGAVAASLSNILFGWLSDRSVARGGGRRGWAAAGIVATGLSYAGIAAADSPAAIVLAIVGFQFAVNILLAPLMAIMADEIPDAQKGIAGGLLSLAAPIAGAMSALLLAFGGLAEPVRLALLVLATALFVLPLMLVRGPRSTASDAAPSLARRDLGVAWIARLLIQIAGAMLSVYLLYYFESVAPGQPTGALAATVAQLLTLSYILPLPVAVLLGRLSDRLGRRKPFLLAMALLAATGLVGMAMADSFAAAALCHALFAIGSASFLALHSGFAMQLLPDPRHRGRDLGVLNLTNTLPSLLGPLLTWLLATPRDFSVALLALAALTVCGGVAILGVQGRR